MKFINFYFLIFFVFAIVRKSNSSENSKNFETRKYLHSLNLVNDKNSSKRNLGLISYFENLESQVFFSHYLANLFYSNNSTIPPLEKGQ